MTRVDEMRQTVNKLAEGHAQRQDTLDALRLDVRQQLTTAAAAVQGMADERTAMSNDLHLRLGSDLADLKQAVEALQAAFLADRLAMAADMKEQLATTRRTREDEVATLQADARQFVGQVADDRQAMAEELSSKLADAQVHLSTTVRTMLGTFTSDRVVMSKEQSASLEANQAARRQTVAEMIANTQALLAQYAAANQANAAAQRATLSADHLRRQQAVAGMIADIQVLLAKFAAANSAQAADLQAFLAADRQSRSASTNEFMARTLADRQAMADDLAKRLDNFKAMLEANVDDTLSNFATERVELHRSLVEMAEIWHEYAAAMRGMPEPPAAPAPAPEAPKPSHDEALTISILSYLAEHPEGAKLVEMEPALGLARPQLGKLLRHLVDAGKVLKDPETLVYKLA